MKKLLNILFVTTQGAYLSKEGETVVVKVDGEVALRLSVHTLGEKRRNFDLTEPSLQSHGLTA